MGTRSTQKKAVEGDIVEIETPKGFAHAQYTHRCPGHGQLIRVFPGFHEQRPDDFVELVRGEEQFLAFVLLDRAVKEGLLAIVGQEEIPEAKRAFPTFRSNVGMKANEVTTNWWLWDGEKEWYVGELTAEQQHLPIDRGISNPAMIVERLLRGWRAEQFL